MSAAFRIHEGVPLPMTTKCRDHADWPIESERFWKHDDVAELALLLPGWQVAELESLAQARRKTLGQLLRAVIDDYLANPTSPAWPVAKR